MPEVGLHVAINFKAFPALSRATIDPSALSSVVEFDQSGTQSGVVSALADVVKIKARASRRKKRILNP